MSRWLKRDFFVFFCIDTRHVSISEYLRNILEILIVVFRSFHDQSILFLCVTRMCDLRNGLNVTHLDRFVMTFTSTFYTLPVYSAMAHTDHISQMFVIENTNLFQYK